jgi:hypothetical protein
MVTDGCVIWMEKMINTYNISVELEEYYLAETDINRKRLGPYIEINIY